MEIPIYYDPMIAKLITYAPTRSEAIQKMREAIQQYHIEGIQTTLPFGHFVFEHDAFISGNFNTHFVKKYFSPELLKEDEQMEAELAAEIALNLFLNNQQQLKVPKIEASNWTRRKS